jgi:hypothetical protein
MNTRMISVSLEMYATDYEGHFPGALSKLTPNYLKEIPLCPGAGSETYTPTYKVTSSAVTDGSGVAPYDQFSFFCGGHHHKAAGIDPDLPGADSWQGPFEFGGPKFYAPGTAPEPEAAPEP